MPAPASLGAGMTIRARAMLYGLGVSSLVLLVISVLLFVVLAGSAPRNQDRDLAERAGSAVASLKGASAADLVPRAPLTPVDAASPSVEILVVVLDADGSPLSSTGTVGGQPLVVPARLLRIATEAGQAVDTVSAGPDGRVRLRVHVRPWQRADLGRSGYVVAAQTTRRLQTDRAGVVVLLVLSNMVSLMAAAVGVALVARMAGRVQAAYGKVAEALAAQQRFTADASHELRTPLTTIRGNAGFLRSHPEAAVVDREAALADIDAEGERMSRLVDDLLTLARADGGQRLQLSTVDLGALAHEVCRQARGLHPARELHCAGVPVTVSGDQDALRRLLWILIENASAHTQDGGNIWVAVTRQDRSVTLAVADDGCGLPADAPHRVFERFFRADESRRPGGVGLGLSIAQWIAREHGGEISAANNERGGASFVVVLPAS